MHIRQCALICLLSMLGAGHVSAQVTQRPTLIPPRQAPATRAAATPQPPSASGMPWAQWVDLFRDYLDLIENFAQVSKDASVSGVAAVVYADDVLRNKGPQEAIRWFSGVLPRVPDPAVQRAIRLRLAELYRTTNQPDKALEQLEVLMTAAPDTRPADAPAKGQ